MSYSSGTFSINSSGQPVVTGTVISSTVFNALTADLATGLSTCVLKDGTQTLTANIPMGAFKLTGVGAATARTDAATLANIQDGTGIYVGTVGGTADAITLTPAPAITAYAAGQAFFWIASGANTGAVTLAVSGLASPKAITKNGTTALSAGDIPSGALVGARYDGTRFQLMDTGLFLGGGTLTGNLNISKTEPIITLNANGSGDLCYFFLSSSGTPRWFIGKWLDAESGGNAGSSFKIRNYNDAGSAISDVIDIARATGQITISGSLITPAATTSIPSIRLPHGTAPTSPTNGDMWTTTAGLFARINSVTNEYARSVSGVYTPTLTNSTNVASSTAAECQYMRVGNTVSVFGTVIIDVTATTGTELNISLPVASNIGDTSDLGGTAATVGGVFECAGIFGEATLETASMRWVAVDVGSRTWAFSFGYQVI